MNVVQKNRDDIIRKLLPEGTEETFVNYQLSDGDIRWLVEFSEGLLGRCSNSYLDCARLSALLGTVIIENSKIPAVVFAGHLDVQGVRLFNCKGPIPMDSIEKKIWDGHCWVELGGSWILDVSLIGTTRQNGVTSKKRQKILEDFPNGYVLRAIDTLHKIGYEYKPCYLVEQPVMDGLIKSWGLENGF